MLFIYKYNTIRGWYIHGIFHEIQMIKKNFYYIKHILYNFKYIILGMIILLQPSDWM